MDTIATKTFATTPSLPDDLDGLLPAEPLTPMQTLLLNVARDLLAPAGILVRATQALPFGLRLYLGYQLPQASAETGQLVLYHNGRGQWVKTVVEGVVTPLALAAARHLDGPEPDAPLW